MVKMILHTFYFNFGLCPKIAGQGRELVHCYAASFPTMPMRADLFTGKISDFSIAQKTLLLSSMT